MTAHGGINTLNESTLHQQLKALYSMEDGSKTEVPLDGKVYDIVNTNGGIVEIQTSSVSSLLGKVTSAIKAGHFVKVVYPVARNKRIEFYDEDGIFVRARGSPLHLSVYNMWRELTGMTRVLLSPYFSLDVVEMAMTEKRIVFDKCVQSANRCRRWTKPWNKADKRLDEVLCTHTFTSASCYMALLPDGLPKVFCAKDVASSIRKDKSLPSSAASQAGCMLWVLSRMAVIECVPNKDAQKDKNGIKHRGKYYKRLC